MRLLGSRLNLWLLFTPAWRYFYIQNGNYNPLKTYLKLTTLYSLCLGLFHTFVSMLRSISNFAAMG